MNYFKIFNQHFLPNDFVWWRFTGFVEFHNHQSSYTSQGLNKKFEKYLPMSGENKSILSLFQKVKNCPKGLGRKKTPNYQNKTYRFTPSKTVRVTKKNTTEHTHEIH